MNFTSVSAVVNFVLSSTEGTTFIREVTLANARPNDIRLVRSKDTTLSNHVVLGSRPSDKNVFLIGGGALIFVYNGP